MDLSLSLGLGFGLALGLGLGQTTGVKIDDSQGKQFQ